MRIATTHPTNLLNAFSAYRFHFNGGEAINEVYGNDNYVDLGERGVDTRLGKLNWSIDPRAAEYPWQSPYAYYANSPIWQLDYKGMGGTSTHTDKDGNVVAVYDDGDNGVYRHDCTGAEAEKHVKKNYSNNNTSAGGKKMGESLHSLSFANQNLYNITRQVKAARIKIDFGSNELTKKVQEIINSNPTVVDYATKARTDGDWDIKSNTYNGSLLYGKYASPRDGGNFAAGAVAQMSGIEPIVQFGYGAYNLTGNNLPLTGLVTYATVFSILVNPTLGFGTAYIIGKYGEDVLTQRSIDLGKQFIKGK